MEIGGYAVKIFEKNENFWGIKRKNLKKLKKKLIEFDVETSNGVVKRKLKKKEKNKKKYRYNVMEKLKMVWTRVK